MNYGKGKIDDKVTLSSRRDREEVRLDMPPLPPLKDVLDALQTRRAAGRGRGALVLCLFLLFGRWAGGARAPRRRSRSAFLWRNFTLDNPEGSTTSRPGRTRARLLPWNAGGRNAPGWHWLPRAALRAGRGRAGVAVDRDCSSRAPARARWWGANLLVWAPRVAAVFVVSGWLVLGKAAAAEQWQWLRWQLARRRCSLVWVALDGVARAGASAEVVRIPGRDVPRGRRGPALHAQREAHGTGGRLGSAMFGIAVARRGWAEADGRLRAGQSPRRGAVLPSRRVMFLPLALGVAVAATTRSRRTASGWSRSPRSLLLPFLIPRCRARTAGWSARRSGAVLDPRRRSSPRVSCSPPQHETAGRSRSEW